MRMDTEGCIGQPTITRAIVGLIFARLYDPIPAEFVEINGQRMQTASQLIRVLIAGQSSVPLASTLTTIVLIGG